MKKIFIQIIICLMLLFCIPFNTFAWASGITWNAPEGYSKLIYNIDNFNSNSCSFDNGTISGNSSASSYRQYYSCYAFDNDYDTNQAANDIYVYDTITFNSSVTASGIAVALSDQNAILDLYLDDVLYNSYNLTANPGSVQFIYFDNNVTFTKAYIKLNKNSGWSGIREFNFITNGEPSVTSPTVVPPSSGIPNVTNINYTINNVQNTYLNTYSSHSVKGGVISYFLVDHWNLYTVYESAVSDVFLDNRNDIYIVYNDDGSMNYIFPIYDYTELYVYAPNMSISMNGWELNTRYVGDLTYTNAISSGVIQSDVSQFYFKYKNKSTEELFGWNRLPFNNSVENTNKVEFIGSEVRTLNSTISGMSAIIPITTATYTFDFNIVITDKEIDYRNSLSNYNQDMINNTLNDNLNHEIDFITNGNSESQSVESNNNQSNQLLANTINQMDSLEYGYKSDLNTKLDNINVNDFNISGITKLSNAANFVRVQFNNLTTNNPFGTILGFSLFIGLSLLIIGKRL